MQAVSVKTELWTLGSTHDDPFLILLINFKTKYSLIVFFDGFNFYSLVKKIYDEKFFRKAHTNISSYPKLEFLA